MVSMLSTENERLRVEVASATANAVRPTEQFSL
jgi:hypothetical protein